jgi:hypothetical protein
VICPPPARPQVGLSSPRALEEDASEHQEGDITDLGKG